MELGSTVRGGNIYFGEHGLFGSLLLQGRAQPLRLDLSGRLPACLQRGHLRFLAAGRPTCRSVNDLSPEQIGPLGNVQLKPGRGNGKAILPPRTFSFFLEWYAQNGHITLEATVDILGFEGSETPGMFSAAPLFTGEDLSRIESNRPVLSPLQPEGVPEVLAEILAADGWMESRDHGLLIRDLYDPPLTAPPPEQLSGEDLERELRILLAQLGRMGICVDRCEHAGTKDTYVYVCDHVLTSETFVNFIPVHTVTHYSVREACAGCRRVFEREWALRRLPGGQRPRARN